MISNTVEIEVRPVTGGIGAEISGINLGEELSAAVVSDLRQALLDHLVIFFRSQEITPAQQLAFVRQFGEPDIYPFVQGLEDYPEITPILK